MGTTAEDGVVGAEKTGRSARHGCLAERDVRVAWFGIAGWEDMLVDMPATLIYRDDLPRDCPPPGAEITGTLVVYRWVEHDPVDPDEDFRMWKDEEENLGRETWPDDNPCIAHAVSLWRTREQAERRLRNLQNRNAHRDSRWSRKRVCKLTLESGAGAIIGTQSAKGGRIEYVGVDESRRGHIEWWPARDFDISAHAELI